MYDAISIRFKEYESVSRQFLINKLPVIVRIDGKAFHTWTRNLNSPFDSDLMEAMNKTTEIICKEMQGFKCAYVQSDEISIVLSDISHNVNTQAWFNNNRDKIISISSSLASANFNSIVTNYPHLKHEAIDRHGLAYFDSRAFNLPLHEVENYLIWRYKDCVRNSLFSVAQFNFSHKELMNKNQSDVHEMLHTKGINWATDFSSWEKNGRFFWKPHEEENSGYAWLKETPDFTDIDFRQTIVNLIQGDIW